MRKIIYDSIGFFFYFLRSKSETNGRCKAITRGIKYKEQMNHFSIIIDWSPSSRESTYF